MSYVIVFLESFLEMFVDISFYLMIGLLIVGIMSVLVKKEKIIKHLGTDTSASVVKASLVGVPLPLCSCGVVPTALELKKSGASNGAVVSFLISTPQTGIDSMAATYSMMGIVMAIYRPIAAFLSGIFGGLLVNLLAKNEKLNVDIALDSCCSHTTTHATSCHSSENHIHSGCCGHSHSHEKMPHDSKVKSVLKYAFCDFLDEISVHFVVGLILASLISAFVPSDFFVNLGLDDGILAMLGMILIGVPMYIW